MARGITIPLTINPAEFIRGVKRGTIALEDLEDSFDEVAREGDSLERSLEENFRDISKKAKKTDITPDKDSNKRAAGVLAGEVVDEFVENWGEAVRSGDYASALRETISQLGQIGGAVAGPAGALVGGALALGLTKAFDSFVRSSEEKARINAAINSLFLDIADEAKEAGGASWTAYRDAVVAAAKSDQAIADALGVESFAEAAQLIASVGEELGQDWENNVILALTDSGPAGENAAKAVQAAWEESNARILELEEEVQTARRNGAEGYALEAQRQLDAERSRNAEMQKGVGWLETQGDIAEGLADEAQNQFQRDQRVTEEKRNQAAASRQTKDNVASTKDKTLPRFEGSTKKAKENTEGAKKAAENVPDIDIKAKVDRREIDNLPTSHTLNVTARVNVQAASAKAQRLLDQGVI